MSVATMPAKRRVSDEPESRGPIFTMRVSVEFREWLTEAAAHSDLSVADFLTQAAKRFAKSEGFIKPAPKR